MSTVVPRWPATVSGVIGASQPGQSMATSYTCFLPGTAVAVESRDILIREQGDDRKTLLRAGVRGGGGGGERLFERRRVEARRGGHAKGAALRQPWKLALRGHDQVAGGAEVLRPGADLRLRVQPRRVDSLVPPGRGTRSAVRDVLLGRRIRVRAEHQRADYGRRGQGSVDRNRAGRCH